MIERSDWFQLNSPSVVCDIVYDDVVLVNLESGAYYSTEKVGVTIWQQIDQGQSVGEIVQTLSGQYSGDTGEIEKNVYDLIGQLLNEGLIVPGHTARSMMAKSGPANNTPARSAQNQKQPFEGVILHKFVDMQDLLLLDPVHEVDDLGWPHASKQ
ncbi:MAG: PqqD family protein [Chloroflexi bacterium]|nr:PqqD family protein [Chloroflexota bacterium]